MTILCIIYVADETLKQAFSRTQPIPRFMNTAHCTCVTFADNVMGAEHYLLFFYLPERERCKPPPHATFLLLLKMESLGKKSEKHMFCFVYTDTAGEEPKEVGWFSAVCVCSKKVDV